MRGFVFSADMVFGTLLVLSVVFLLVNTPTAPSDSFAKLRVQAKDASLMWVYTNTPTNPAPAPTSVFACDTAFRPATTPGVHDPSNASAWATQTNCAVAP